MAHRLSLKKITPTISLAAQQVTEPSSFILFFSSFIFFYSCLLTSSLSICYPLLLFLSLPLSFSLSTIFTNFLLQLSLSLNVTITVTVTMTVTVIISAPSNFDQSWNNSDRTFVHLSVYFLRFDIMETAAAGCMQRVRNAPHTRSPGRQAHNAFSFILKSVYHTNKPVDRNVKNCEM